MNFYIKSIAHKSRENGAIYSESSAMISSPNSYSFRGWNFSQNTKSEYVNIYHLLLKHWGILEFDKCRHFPLEFGDPISLCLFLSLYFALQLPQTFFVSFSDRIRGHGATRKMHIAEGLFGHFLSTCTQFIASDSRTLEQRRTWRGQESRDDSNSCKLD